MSLWQRKERTEKLELFGLRCTFSASPALREYSLLLFFLSSLSVHHLPPLKAYPAPILQQRSSKKAKVHSGLLPFPCLPYLQSSWKEILFSLYEGEYFMTFCFCNCIVLALKLGKVIGVKEKACTSLLRGVDSVLCTCQLKAKQKIIAFHPSLSQHTLGVRSPHLQDRCLPVGIENLSSLKPEKPY